jgi:hypothetical protein
MPAQAATLATMTTLLASTQTLQQRRVERLTLAGQPAPHIEAEPRVAAPARSL